MKQYLIIGFLSFLLTFGFLFSTQKVQAWENYPPFNPCNIFPFLPFCNDDEEEENQITICHQTESEQNPWEEITINENAWDAHSEHGDFIVSEEYPCPPQDEDEDEEDDEDEQDEEETPIANNPQPAPQGCTGDCSAPAPVCTEPFVVDNPINFHVYRNGDSAILRWWQTAGNQVNVYWKHPASSEWEHSLHEGNTGFVEIHGLGSDDWTFGLQQVNNCGGGVITVGNLLSVVDGSTDTWVLFK